MFSQVSQRLELSWHSDTRGEKYHRANEFTKCDKNNELWVKFSDLGIPLLTLKL